jgi:hypothetical protein
VYDEVVPPIVGYKKKVKKLKIMSEYCPFNQRMFRPQVQSEAEEVWLSIGRIFHRLTLTGQVIPRHFLFNFFYFSEAN